MTSASAMALTSAAFPASMSINPKEPRRADFLTGDEYYDAVRVYKVEQLLSKKNKPPRIAERGVLPGPDLYQG